MFCNKKARNATWDSNISFNTPGCTFSTISYQKGRLLLNNPTDSDLHAVKYRPVHVGTTKNIYATFIGHGHSRVLYEIAKPLLNSLYSALLYSSSLLLYSQASQESKNMWLCNIFRIIFLLYLISLITLI